MADSKNASGDKPKRARKMGPPKPFFLVFTGDDVDVHGMTKDAAEALEWMEEHEGSRYIKYVPPTREPAAA